MNKIKKLLISATLAAGIGISTVVVVPVVTAERASALTMTQCSYTWTLTYLNSYVWTKRRVCYYDYNWWEEFSQGKRDGWYADYPLIYT